MGIEPTEDASQRPPPVLKTGPRTSQGRATAEEANRFRFGDQWKRAGLLDGAAAEFPEGPGLAREAELLRPGGGKRAGRLDRDRRSREREAGVEIAPLELGAIGAQLEAHVCAGSDQLVPGLPGLIIHHFSPRERRVALEQRLAFRIRGRVALGSPLLFRGSPRGQRSAGACPEPSKRKIGQRPQPVEHGGSGTSEGGRRRDVVQPAELSV